MHFFCFASHRIYHTHTLIPCIKANAPISGFVDFFFENCRDKCTLKAHAPNIRYRRTSSPKTIVFQLISTNFSSVFRKFIKQSWHLCLLSGRGTPPAPLSSEGTCAYMRGIRVYVFATNTTYRTSEHRFDVHLITIQVSGQWEQKE